MRKGKDIIGKTVVAYNSGRKLQTIKDLIFDQDENRLLGFLIKESGWFSSAKVLPLSLVKAIGVDAIIVASKDAIGDVSQYPTIEDIIKNNNLLNGTRIMTTDGRDLGKLIDLYFDEQTGIVEGYEVSGGLFADAYSGRAFVPAPHTLNIGRDVAFVPTETVGLMEEQVGGIKAAMQNANEKLQATAQSASEKIQDTAQIAGAKIQDTAQSVGAKLQDTAQLAGENMQTAGRAATTRLTDTVVDRSAQKAFVLNKVAQQTVYLPNGDCLVLAGEVITLTAANTAERLDLLDGLYRSAGGSLTIPLRARLDRSVAELTIEQAQGRRAQRAIYTPEGYIIAAQGQIITERTIERTKAAHQESDLLDAVGLSASDAAQSQAGNFAIAAQSQANNFAMVTGSQLKATTANASERLQSDATNLWAKVKETANEVQGRSAQALEEKRIKGALGRPTTRVILDRQDEVILNVGELISHKAIANARSAGILDVLLDSVYTEKPQQLSLEQLRAPGVGNSALS